MPPVPDASESPRPRAAGKFLRAGASKLTVRGVSYGPFEPGAPGAPGLKEGAALAADLDAIAGLGANTVRVYEVPPRPFLDACGERGLRVLVGVPWPQHVDFTGGHALWEGCVAAVREAARALAGHPALLAFLVGNEIEATLVRWLGPTRVKRLLEELIEAGRDEDPGALFAYANYPSTEYLNPDNADFLAYNIYLERRCDYARYLRRLQNIAGDRPLLVTEFGADSLALGRAVQAEVLDWGVAETFAGGAAGIVVFAFTDEWFRGGAHVRGWDFGLVTRDRQPKPARDAVARRFAGTGTAAGALPLDRAPGISVIVCTHNGARTLGACLESLAKLDYPDFEVIVVDDGSTDATPEIAAAAAGARYLRTEHIGLSAARNLGAGAAEGEIFAYTDDDCIADEGWLRHLAAAFAAGRYAAAGGPNIAPPPTDLGEACVAAAPGAPAHVLLDDELAEHLPGCNLAVTRDAFEAVGGFRDEFRTAGDDVDFCWRLIDAGHRVGFVPGAMVWHHRRSTVKAYLKQQIGYGRAEALLIGRHPARFGQLGGARWRGAVYSGQRGALGLRSRIYRGVFGYAPFGAVYAEPDSDFFHIATSVQWALISFALLAAGAILSPPLLALGGAMALGTLFFAAREAGRAGVDRRFDGFRARALLVFLCLAQPLLRGGVRTWGAFRAGKVPRGPIWGQAFARPRRAGVWKRVGRLELWSERALGRDLLLEKTANTLRRLGWAHTVDNGWNDWDLELRRGLLWRVRLATVTEYHGDGRCLTRARFSSKPTVWALLAMVAISLACVWIAWGHPARALPCALGFAAAWSAFELRHRAAVAGMLRLVENVAEELGFDRP